MVRESEKNCLCVFDIEAIKAGWLCGATSLAMIIDKVTGLQGVLKGVFFVKGFMVHSILVIFTFSEGFLFK